MNYLKNILSQKTFKFLAVAVILLAIPVTMFLSNKSQDIRQHASEVTTPAGIDPTFYAQRRCEPVELTNLPSSLQNPVYCLANVQNCIVRGDGSGALKDTEILTRKEAIAYYARFHVNVARDWTWDTSGTPFSDVTSTHPLFKEIQTAKNKGVTKGKGVDGAHPTAWFDPDGAWTFNVTTMNQINPADNRGTGITRGEFIQQFYTVAKPALTSCGGAAAVSNYSRCSRNNGCQRATFQSVDGGQHISGNPSYVVDVSCGIIAGTDTTNPINASCPRQATTAPIPMTTPVTVSQQELVGCDNLLDYPATLQTTYPQIPSIVSCFHKSYCVVQGSAHSHGDALEYEKKLTRGEYVTFLTRYHVEVLKDEWKAAFENILDYYNLPTTKKFLDVSASQASTNYHPQWKEIYTSQKMGFIQGFEDNTFQPEELWKYGFHGVTRTDTYKGVGYNFTVPGALIARGEFLTQLYDYGMNQTGNLTACINTPSPTHAGFPSPSPVQIVSVLVSTDNITYGSQVTTTEKKGYYLKIKNSTYTGDLETKTGDGTVVKWLRAENGLVTVTPQNLLNISPGSYKAQFRVWKSGANTDPWSNQVDVIVTAVPSQVPTATPVPIPQSIKSAGMSLYPSYPKINLKRGGSLESMVTIQNISGKYIPLIISSLQMTGSNNFFLTPSRFSIGTNGTVSVKLKANSSVSPGVYLGTITFSNRSTTPSKDVVLPIEVTVTK